MDKIYERKFHILEEKNWWFRARRQIILNLINEMKLNRGSRILDVGCSSGSTMKFLNKEGFSDTYGIDISENAIALAKKRNMRNVFIMNGTEPRFDKEYFDLIIASDVLEHIEEDSKALRNWYRILKPKGKLIIFVPALDLLWGQHDQVNHHFRRYSRSSLKRVLEKASFKILRISYWNFILFLPKFFFIKIFERNFMRNRKKKHDQLYDLNPAINNILFYFLSLENRNLKRLGLPFGVSLFSIAKK